MVNRILFIILFVNQVFAGIPAVIAERESIRIAAFYCNSSTFPHLNNQSDLDNASPQERQAISEQFVPAAISYYQTTLKVNRRKTPIVIDQDHSRYCAQVRTQKSMEKRVEADLVLLITGSLDTRNSADYASAVACDQESSSKRAKVGSIWLNLKMFKEIPEESILLITMHEIGHILGFDRDLFQDFMNPLTGERLLDPKMRKEVNGVMVTVLKLEPLTQRLRDYFACPTLEGAYLEQQGDIGSAGSHFERRIFMNEFMTAGVLSDARVSEFFLALLEGTGWYTPNYEMSDPIFWGKGKGCDFLDTKCLNSEKESNFPDHFCGDFYTQSCSPNRATYGTCGHWRRTEIDHSLEPAFDYWGGKTIISSDGYSDNCPYYSELVFCEGSSYSSYKRSKKEFFGPQSACFTGNLDEKGENPFCFKKSCQKVESGQYILNVEIGTSTVVCKKEGPIQVDDDDHKQGFINCPDPVSYCTIINPSSFCRRGCMGRGTCVNNQCVCNEGYEGSDCSSRNVNTTQAEGLPIEYNQVKEATQVEELPTESAQVKEEPQNSLRLIIELIFFITSLVLCVVLKRKEVKIKEKIDQDLSSEIKLQKTGNSGESTSLLEMPHLLLTSVKETQTAEKETSSIVSFRNLLES